MGATGGQLEISQRDLRMRSKEIMDAVERGERFTVTRDGRGIGELIPLRRRSTFLSREEFTALGTGLGAIDPDRFRSDLDSVVDPQITDPYER